MKHRFAYLDGIRGLAAIFVVTRHTPSYWDFNVFHSYLAVDLFFILSGFVIAHAYEDKLTNGSISFFKFIKIRLIRLYPIFGLSITLCAINLLLNQHLFNGNDAIEFFTTALFIPYPTDSSPELFPLNNPYWSLFYELIINFVYASTRKWQSTNILLSIISISALLLIGIAYTHNDLNAGFFMSIQSISAGIVRAAFGFFTGVLLYRYHAKIYNYTKNRALPYVAFIIVLVSLSLPYSDYIAWIDVITVCILFPICVAFAATPTSRSKSESILLALGSASYPIYVLHKPLSEITSLLINNAEVKFAPYSGIAFMLTIFGLSIFLEKYYDIPFRKKLTRAFVK
ncbi:acyltransferase [Methylomonas sp. AM2-LC]|uniref:acyltransferase family protein n=1 Tax=Methylomonas sp. AM2-LC TaxID=3153301 RepID=UPI0032637DA5